MDETASVGDDKVVAIAVNKGHISQAAVKWAIENLVVGGGSVLLLHVRAKSLAFDPKVTNPHVVRAYSGIDVLDGLQDGYKDALDQHAMENLHSFVSYCRKKKVQSEMVILEDNDKAKAISDYVFANHINLLVVGSRSGSNKGVLKKLSGPDSAARISRKAPYFCTVYIVARGRVQSVRAASSTPHNFSGNDFNDLEYHKTSHDHEPYIHQFSFSESSVSSRVALLRPDESSDFELKSPNGHSDFTIRGTSTLESDTSFLSNDKGSHRSSSLSRSSTFSDWSLDSYEHPYLTLSGGNSLASSSPESIRISIDDKLQKLQLEMINSKGVYDSVPNEARETNVVTNIKDDSLHIEEIQECKVTCRSTRPITKFESKRL